MAATITDHGRGFLLLLLLLAIVTATTTAASTAADEDGNGAGAGGGSSGVQLMVESFNEIASCPGKKQSCIYTHTSIDRLTHSPSPHARRLLPPLPGLGPLPRHHGLRRPLRPRAGACW
jgi:hypothetical protein